MAGEISVSIICLLTSAVGISTFYYSIEFQFSEKQRVTVYCVRHFWKIGEPKEIGM